MRALVSLQMQGMPRAFEAFPAFFIWRSGARTFFQKNGDPFSHLFLCFFEHRSIHQIAAEGIGRALPLLFERRAGRTGEERVDLPFVFGGIHGAGDVGEVPAGRQVRPHGIEDAALEVDQPGYLPGLAKELLKDIEYDTHPIRLIGLSISNPYEKNEEKARWEQLSFEFSDWE